MYKVEIHGIEPSDDLSAYRLLKAANLSSSHGQLVKATINSLSLDEVKTKLSKIFSEDSSMTDSMDKITLKEEPTIQKMNMKRYTLKSFEIIDTEVTPSSKISIELNQLQGQKDIPIILKNL